MTESSQLYDTPAVARRLGLAEITLRKWRTQNRREGPAWIKCGKSVRYREADIEAWLERRTVTEQ